MPASVSLRLYTTITDWMSGIQRDKPPIQPSNTDNVDPSPETPEALTASASTLNSVHRSTYEFLKALPAPMDMLRALPTLPTQHATPYELLKLLPHPIIKPLVSSPQLFSGKLMLSRYRPMKCLHQILLPLSRQNTSVFSTYGNAYASRRLH